MSAKNFMSYGDAETVFTSFANAIKNNEDAVAAVTSALAAIKDGTDIDSFGDVEVALLDKADTSDLGTAAAKDSTNSVTAGSTDLVESGAVREAIDASVAAAYHHAGTKTVAQLTHDLLIAANEGNVYNITDSGTTTSDFIEGIGKQIDAGDNVGICKVGNVYMFDLLSGLEDTSGFVRKSQTSGLLKNDGTVNTTIEDKVNTLQSEKADTDIVASDFDANEPYTAGNYCIYEGKFYKFKNNHSGAWEAADVDEIKIAGELRALKSGLNSLIVTEDRALSFVDGACEVTIPNGCILIAAIGVATLDYVAGIVFISYPSTYKLLLKDTNTIDRTVRLVYASKYVVLST